MATGTSGTPISLSATKLEPLIKEERTKCTSLGLQLDIPLSQLQNLEKESKVRKPNRECFMEMCKLWLEEKDGHRKWSEVYEALEQQGNRRLKNILERKYKDTPVQLEVKDFLKELKEMTPRWYQFGCALGLSTTDLNDLKEDEGGLEVYMIKMLEVWENTEDDKYTWETLQEALRVIGNRRLATNLDKHRLKDQQALLPDSAKKDSSDPKAQADESSSDKYACQVYYQRRGVNTWKTTFAIFPCDKSDRVKGDKDEQEGPSCTFDLETDEVGIAHKGQVGWDPTVTRKEVTKASVDLYTGTGKPPSCEMMVTPASSESTPPDLAMEVELIGPKLAKIMKLEQRAENVSIQAPPTSSIRVPH